MDVVIAKKDLKRLVSHCQDVADKKSAMPALANALLATEGETLRVSATDTFQAITGFAPAEVVSAGSIAVPAKDLYERIDKMPEGPIQLIASEGAKLTLKAVGSPRRYTLHGIPGNEFPPLPQRSGDAPTLQIPASLLRLLIRHTHFSISTDETRAHVNSALFEWAGDKVRMVTTDGHRLSKMEVTVDGSSATATMLIPRKAINALKRLAEDSDNASTDTVTISQAGSNAFFSIGDALFSAKLVDAQFPPYQQVIPALTDRSIRAPKQALDNALNAIRVAASDRTGGVKLSTANGSLRITSESPESGNGFDEVSVDYTGPEITIGFNATYFTDVLKAIDDSDEVLLGISGELDPAVIRPATELDGQSYIAVVMPMKI